MSEELDRIARAIIDDNRYIWSRRRCLPGARGRALVLDPERRPDQRTRVLP
jgi:hypothetical protein